MYCTSGLLAYPAPRVGSLSETVYPSAAYATPAGQGYMSFGAESSAFYTPLSGDTTDAWRSFSQTAGAASSGWPYDSSMCAYPYGARHRGNYVYTLSPTGYTRWFNKTYGGLDVRRKNATRESTSTLKAWLYEHIKNPYPTKGEKIMLAIITKMTLTQVSTWFANARRRLKKENKMQWSPRNRTENDDDDKTSSDDDDDDGADGKDGGGRAAGGTAGGGGRTGGGGCQKKPQSKEEDEDIVVDNGGVEELNTLPNTTDCGLSDLVCPRGPCSAKYGSGPPSSSQDNLIHQSQSIPGVTAGISPRCSLQGFLSPCGVTSAASSSSLRPDHPFYYTLGGKPPANMVAVGSGSLYSRSPLSSLPSAEESIEMKPRIWSLADVATSRSSHHQRHSGQLALTVVGAGGSMTGGLPGIGGANGSTLGQNFQPWANGVYCEDSHFTSASSYAAMTSHTAAMTLPFDKTHCDSATGLSGGQTAPPTAVTGLNGVRRLSTSGQHSGHYSCRLASMATQENTEVAGKAAAAAAAAVHGDLNLMQGGLNGTRYPHQMDCSASAPNASNTAFKPFPKRLGS